MHGHEYKQLKPAGVLRDYHKQLREWHLANGLGPFAGDREFDEYLEQSYSEASDHNQRINRERSEYLFLCNRWLIRVVMAAVLLLITFGVAVQVQSQIPRVRDRPTQISPTHQNGETHGKSSPETVGASSQAGSPAVGQHPRGAHSASGPPGLKR
jgi:hypothetical protein